MTKGDSTTPNDLPSATVCVLIVTFNSAGHIPRLLASLKPAADGLTIRVVVVDNGSQDESAAIARQQGADVVIDAGANLGYAGGINVGRPWGVGCEMLLVANPDMVFDPSSISLLYTAARVRGAVTVPRILGADRLVRPSLRREPTISRQFGEALFGDHWSTRPSWLSIIMRDSEAYLYDATVDWATGAALMIPASCDIAVGKWDEDFFLYSEEVDFARLARSNGFAILYVPKAIVVHYEGGSGRSARLAELDAINRIRHFANWNGRPRTTIYALVIAFELLLRLGRPGNYAAFTGVVKTLRAWLASGQIQRGDEILRMHVGGQPTRVEAPASQGRRYQSPASHHGSPPL